MKNDIIITGGANGIGLECAKLYKSKGYNVFVLDIDKVEGKKLSKYGIHYYVCDVSSEDDVNYIANLMLPQLNQLVAIINCAAIQIEEDFECYNQKKWKKVINTNYFGVCNVIHAFFKFLSEGSTILNLISVHSVKPRTKKYAYDSSKSAIEILTKELALEFAPHKITVNALSFGAVETDMNNTWLTHSEQREIARAKVPLKIVFNPVQIANFTYVIIKVFSKYTTGSVFVIDGGRSLN